MGISTSDGASARCGVVVDLQRPVVRHADVVVGGYRLAVEVEDEALVEDEFVRASAEVEIHDDGGACRLILDCIAQVAFIADVHFLCPSRLSEGYEGDDEDRCLVFFILLLLLC